MLKRGHLKLKPLVCNYTRKRQSPKLRRSFIVFSTADGYKRCQFLFEPEIHKSVYLHDTIHFHALDIFNCGILRGH